jgi:integrin beta 1
MLDIPTFYKQTKSKQIKAHIETMFTFFFQTCPGKCEELQPCVQCLQFQSGPYIDQTDEFGEKLCDKCEFEIIEVEKSEDYLIEDERLCSFIDDDDCRATFVYGYHNATGQLQVWVQTTKECPVVVDIMGIVLGVIGAIVAIGMYNERLRDLQLKVA